MVTLQVPAAFHTGRMGLLNREIISDRALTSWSSARRAAVYFSPSGSQYCFWGITALGEGSRVGVWSSLCRARMALIAVLSGRDWGRKWARWHMDNRPIHSVAGGAAMGVCRGTKGSTYSQRGQWSQRWWPQPPYQKLWFFPTSLLDCNLGIGLPVLLGVDGPRLNLWYCLVFLYFVLLFFESSKDLGQSCWGTPIHLQIHGKGQRA